MGPGVMVVSNRARARCRFYVLSILHADNVFEDIYRSCGRQHTDRELDVRFMEYIDISSAARLEAWRTGWRRVVGWLERDAAYGFVALASRASSARSRGVAPLWSLPFHRGGVGGLH